MTHVCILQVKYDELLQRCQQTSDQLSHKSVQTSSSPFATNRTRRRLSSSATQSDLKVVLEDGQQPEYKALFNEIFTCIQKTKVDLNENRRPVEDNDRQGPVEWSWFTILGLAAVVVCQRRNNQGCFGINISRGSRWHPHTHSLVHLTHTAGLFSPVILTHLCFCLSALLL